MPLPSSPPARPRLGLSRSPLAPGRGAAGEGRGRREGSGSREPLPLLPPPGEAREKREGELVIPVWSPVLGDSAPVAAASRPHGARLPETGRPGDLCPANLAQQTPPPGQAAGESGANPRARTGQPPPPAAGAARSAGLSWARWLGGEEGGGARGRGTGRAFKAGSGQSWRSRAAVGARAGVRLFMFRSGPLKCFPRRRSQSLWRLPLFSSSPALPPPRPLVLPSPR